MRSRGEMPNNMDSMTRPIATLASRPAPRPTIAGVIPCRITRPVIARALAPNATRTTDIPVPLTDDVAERAVQTANRQQHGGARERGEQHERESPRRHRLRHDVVERLDARHRLEGIDAPDVLAHGGHERQRIDPSRRTDDHRGGHGPWRLGMRDVNLLRHRHVQAEMFNVSDDADDGTQRTLRCTGDGNAAAEGILARPQLLCRRLADDGDGCRALGVRGFEPASPENGDAHRREIVGADGVGIRDGRSRGILEGTALDSNSHLSHRPGHWQHGRAADAGDARHRHQSPGQFIVELGDARDSADIGLRSG